MGVDERERHLLHQRLEHLLGPAEAATLMTLLLPVDWSEVASKQDLRELEARLTATLHETIYTSMLAMNRSTILAVVGSVLGSTTCRWRPPASAGDVTTVMVAPSRQTEG